MRTQLTKTALSASLGLAMSFTLSCSSDNDDGDKSSGSAAGVSSSSSVVSGSPSSSGGNSSSSSVGVESVPINGQVWMKKNLNVPAAGSKCYGEGGQVNDPESNKPITLSDAEVQANCDTYGRLYNWATAMNLPASCNSSLCASQIQPKHRGICPEGWHIPSGADWNALMKTANSSCSDNSSCAGAGTKLKSAEGWNPDGGVPVGTDEFGFSALPGGYGYSDGDFDIAGDRGYWWSATELNSDGAYLRFMYYDNEDAYWKGNDSKDLLFSVRCLQD